MTPSIAQLSTFSPGRCLADNQLDEALKQLSSWPESDPENTEALIHIGGIQRRQGHYEDALATIRKARTDATSLEAATTRAALDVLGRFDEAPNLRRRWSNPHARNGAYTAKKKPIAASSLTARSDLPRREQDRSSNPTL